MKNKNFAIAMAAIVVLAVVLIIANSGKRKSTQSELFPEGTTGKVVQTTQPAEQQSTSAAVQENEYSRPDPTYTGSKAYQPPTKADVDAAKAAGTRHATIKTARGTIVVELDGKDAPLTVANFVKLANAKFYDGLTFHRVEPGFVIQGGDPNGDGSGGPGYQIKREISPKLRHIEGALAMARSQDPDSAGSQFYITLAATPSLDDEYAVFGKVTKGMNVVKSIKVGDKITSITIGK